MAVRPWRLARELDDNVRRTGRLFKRDRRAPLEILEARGERIVAKLEEDEGVRGTVRGHGGTAREGSKRRMHG